MHVTIRRYAFHLVTPGWHFSLLCSEWLTMNASLIKMRVLFTPVTEHVIYFVQQTYAWDVRIIYAWEAGSTGGRGLCVGGGGDRAGKTIDTRPNVSLFESSTVILKDYFCTMTLKNDQGHMIIIKPIQFYQLCKLSDVNGCNDSLFQRSVLTLFTIYLYKWCQRQRMLQFKIHLSYKHVTYHSRKCKAKVSDMVNVSV